MNTLKATIILLIVSLVLVISVVTCSVLQDKDVQATKIPVIEEPSTKALEKKVRDLNNKIAQLEKKTPPKNVKKRVYKPPEVNRYVEPQNNELSTIQQKVTSWVLENNKLGHVKSYEVRQNGESFDLYIQMDYAGNNSIPHHNGPRGSGPTLSHKTTSMYINADERFRDRLATMWESICTDRSSKIYMFNFDQIRIYVYSYYNWQAQ